MKLIDSSFKKTGILIIVVLALTSCGGIYQTHYEYVPPKSNIAKMCTAQCIQGKNQCQQMCQMNYDNCVRDAKHDAYHRYQAYKSDRMRHGEDINRSISFFDNSYLCRKDCQCDPTFNDCYSACGGKVLAHRICVAFCGKK